MNSFEDPIQFSDQKRVGDVELIYSDLMEVSQGGPVVGKLNINGKMIDGRYGGPAICIAGYVYLPIYERRGVISAFKLVRINTSSFAIEYLTPDKDLIFLDKVEENQVRFFEDFDKTILSYCKI